MCASSHRACLYSFNIFVIFPRTTTRQQAEMRAEEAEEIRRRTPKCSEIKNRLYLTNLLKSFDLLPPLPPPALQCPPACDLNLSPLVGQVPISQMPGTVPNLCPVTYHYQGAAPLATADGCSPRCPSATLRVR